MKKGFTLIEILVSAAVFMVIAMSAYQAYSSLFTLLSLNQFKILALNLANEQFEIIRNLSYADVGEQFGIPDGKIPHVQNLVRGGITTTIRNIDLPFDGTIGGSPNDPSPADNKLIEVQVDCVTCNNFTPVNLTTTIAPKNLETASTNGALFIKVFDANGLPVSDADVHIVNNTVSPNIIMDDVTDVNGMLQVVDVPPGVNAYNITVSKPGYSTSRTYLSGETSNPNPTQPDATVVIQQVTQVSFAIDQLSTMTFSSVGPTCTPVGDIDFFLMGSKTIGENIFKYSRSHSTNGSGIYSNSSMEWDTYTVGNLDSAYDIIGVNPLNPIPLNPNSTQNVQFVVAPKNPRSILVTVKDNSTGLPVAGATVEVNKVGGGYSSTQVTDRGYINQTDWSEGPGQFTYLDPKKYFADEGGIDVSNPIGELKLFFDGFESYAPNGNLESSVIDTGSPSNFHDLIWLPTDQPVQTGVDSVKFQLATNSGITASTTWDYKGPDGTAATYYTIANSNVSTVHNGDRYVRYKAFLNTESSTSTPNISDVAFTYTSSCTPPGQVIFSGLDSGTYNVTVSKAGYTTYITTDFDLSSSWIEKIIPLSP
jgi:prepilin-type N-terminal cleavage/methylation domain-containing protein